MRRHQQASQQKVSREDGTIKDHYAAGITRLAGSTSIIRAGRRSIPIRQKRSCTSIRFSKLEHGTLTLAGSDASGERRKLCSLRGRDRPQRAANMWNRTTAAHDRGSPSGLTCRRWFQLLRRKSRASGAARKANFRVRYSTRFLARCATARRCTATLDRTEKWPCYLVTPRMPLRLPLARTGRRYIIQPPSGHRTWRQSRISRGVSPAKAGRVSS